MGVFSGSISYTKFYVRGEVPKRFQAAFQKNIQLRTFVPLSTDEDEEERSGWCAASNALDLDLSQQKWLFDRYLVLGMRVDKWRIPRALLKAQLAEATTELLERKGKAKLSRPEKDELKFRITKRLRKKVLPSMRQFDLCWDLDRGVLLFWNRSPRMIDDLMVLFERTFSMQLEPASPYVEAKELLSKRGLDRVHALEQSSF